MLVVLIFIFMFPLEEIQRTPNGRKLELTKGIRCISSALIILPPQCVTCLVALTMVPIYIQKGTL